MEAFQLRLWDGRIGRWLSPDPYGQYFSPYSGMGNNPVSHIDPDGGYESWLGAFFGWVGGGFSGSITSNPAGEGNTDPSRNYGILQKSGSFDSSSFRNSSTGITELGGITLPVIKYGQGSNIDSNIRGIGGIFNGGNNPNLQICKFPDEVTFFLGGAEAKAASGLGRVFWSGGEQVMLEAELFAKANNLTTLEMTRAGKNLTKLTKGLPRETSAPMWERLSKVYAKGAQGNVHVLQNASHGIRIESVWATKEYPILAGKNNMIFYDIFTP